MSLHRISPAKLISLALLALAILLMLSEPLLGQESSGQFGAATTIATALALTIITVIALPFSRLSAFWLTVLGSGLIGLALNSFHQLADERQVLRYLLIASIIILTFVLTRRAVSAVPPHPIPIIWTFRSTILLGLAFSVPTLIAGSARIVGFRASSPTIFSYALAIAVCVLAWRGRGFLDFVLVLVAAFMIYATGTRTNLILLALVLALFLVSRLSATLLKSGYMRSARTAIICGVGLIALMPMILTVLGSGSRSIVDTFDDLGSRAAASDSTRTRSQFYSEMLAEISIDTALFGQGAGWAFDLISENSGRRVAPHMDLLALAVDFGLVAVLAVACIAGMLFIQYGSSYGAFAIVVAYIVSGQFHNVMYSPMSLLLTSMALALLLPVRNKSTRSITAHVY